MVFVQEHSRPAAQASVLFKNKPTAYVQYCPLLTQSKKTRNPRRCQICARQKLLWGTYVAELRVKSILADGGNVSNCFLQDNTIL